jgi:hypothetical protein
MRIQAHLPCWKQNSFRTTRRLEKELEARTTQQRSLLLQRRSGYARCLRAAEDLHML